MDVPTHALMAGAIAAGAMPNQPALAWCFVAGSVAPDLDLALRFYDRAAFLRYHQGVTHSLPGILALAGISATASWLVTGGYHAPLACLAFTAGMAFHSLLDWTNTFGLMAFAPFSRRRMCAEWLFCVDAFATLVSVAALLAALWAEGLVRSLVTAAYLVLIATYWYWHARLRRRAQGMGPPGTRSLIPTSVFPWVFLGCISEGRRATTFQLNTRTKTTSDVVEWELFDDEYHDRLTALPEFRAMRALSDLYHVVAHERVEGGAIVFCKDLRIRNLRTRFGELRAFVGADGRARTLSFRI